MWIWTGKKCQDRRQFVIMKHGASCNCFVFVFDVVCYFQIMDFGLHFSQFGQHSMLIDFFLCNFLDIFLLGEVQMGNIRRELLKWETKL
jgi:hypothetical protein